MKMLPVKFQWDGEAMVPLTRFAALCDRQFVVGEQYPLVVEEDRSRATHNHYFAALHEAWQNLPEQMQPEFPDEEMLRKRALIHTGFADVRSTFCGTREAAELMARFVRPMDRYALVVFSGPTLNVYTAQSQSQKAMGRKRFQESKTKVLDWVANLIGSTRAELEENAKRVA